MSGFLQQVKSVLHCGAIRHSELCREQVRRVALVTGAGASMLGDAVAAGADIYLTGRYENTMIFMLPTAVSSLSMWAIFESEYCAIGLLHDIITKKIATFAVHESVHSVNPVNYFI
ncbi:Nif3-like dinuclear metal center hexameric protein [Alistipes indistinctus]|uniref:Nif3-like dinuclear metal center hexameric protein n=1 Tax=Alistipes indistinctus TaxID=626932 RepID=UPI0035217C65